jgi:hypothetical protein
MRINEILVEGPFAAMGKIARDAKQGYRAGYNAVDKVLSPSKWGDATPGVNQTGSTVRTSTPNHVIKAAINKVVNNEKLYNEDITVLKTAKAKIESGELAVKDDKNDLINVLRYAYSLKPINDQQKQMLARLASQL